MINVTMNGLDNPNQNNIYGVIGTTPVQILSTSVLAAIGKSQLRQFLEIHNPSSTGVLAFTTDGTIPVINGTGTTLYQGSTSTYDVKVPPGPITLVASAASTAYTILSM